MNERIQALVGQAKFMAEETINKKISKNAELDAFAEKFAELFIKECGQVLVDNTPVIDLVEDWDKGYDRAMNDCIHHIYEHFGVEE